jgi:hypothetical protein
VPIKPALTTLINIKINTSRSLSENSAFLAVVNIIIGIPNNILNTKLLKNTMIAAVTMTEIFSYPRTINQNITAIATEFISIITMY